MQHTSNTWTSDESGHQLSAEGRLPETPDRPRGHQLGHDAPRPAQPRPTQRLSQIRNADAELDRLTTHVRGFATMMTELRGEDLGQWITDVEQDTYEAFGGRPILPRPAPPG
jgi:hypothetical protein